MLTGEWTREGDAAVVALVGNIDESADLAAVFSQAAGQVIVNCRKVARINSIGVMAWVRCFGALRSRGVVVTLRELPPVLVEQLNMVADFDCGATVESLYLPYVDPSDGKEFVCLVTVETLRKHGFSPPQIQVPGSEQMAEFDELPQDYFSYFLRKHAQGGSQ